MTITTSTRELQITYDGLTMGAGTAYLIDGKIAISSSYGSGSLGFDLIVTGADEATFLAACDAIEAEDENPRGRVQVVYGATTHIDWNPDPTLNTGFNTQFTSSKPGSQHDTARSRRYRIEIAAELPYTLAGSAGRALSTTTNLTFTDAGRMRLFLQGSYRALGSNGAREQYNSVYYSTWVQSVLTGFGGTWEGPFDVNSSSDDADKNISFSQTWEELIFNQSVGTLDDPVLRRQTLDVTRLVEAPGDSVDQGAVSRLETISVNYEVAVDKTQTQDLVSVYNTRVLPFLLATARKVSGSGLIALVSQDPGYNFPENRLNVSLTILAAGTSNILASNYRTDDAIDYGADLVGAWTGNRMSKHDFTGEGKMTRTITQVYRRLQGGSSAQGVSPAGGSSGSNKAGTFGVGSLGSGGSGGFDFSTPGAGGDVTLNAPNQGSGGDGGLSPTLDPSQVSYYQPPDGGTLVAKLLGETQTKIPIVLGRAGDPQIGVTDFVTVTRYEFFVRIEAGTTPPGKTATGNGNGQSADSSGGAPAQSNPPGTQSA